MVTKVHSILQALSHINKVRDTARSEAHHRVQLSEATLLDVTNVMLASSWSVSRAKRFLDVIASLLAIMLLSPFLLVIALIVGFSTKGPIIFSQERLGIHGRLFTIFKFRTMQASSERRIGPAITVHGDPRITRLGALLRRYKLDELPQFYNVLKGDMSLVGPRPKLPHHNGMGMPFRPGLTGAATLAFRREEEMLRFIPVSDIDRFYDQTIKPTKAQLDSEYMESATLASDLVVMIRTAIACVVLESDWMCHCSLHLGRSAHFVLSGQSGSGDGND
jgi:lipopolysaccharide/colanic/teichoic acid biosynthesis glycosyltransferase